MKFGMVLTLLVSLALAALSISVPEDRTQHQYPERTARTTYITHNPILIDGNAGFTNASGVVWGSGTESDPYMIEGWDINASTANGIEIRTADAHFIVRGCHIHDGDFDYWNRHDGIYLLHCANGTLDGNNCSNNQYGIGLSSSSDNILSNNNCSSNYNHGINLDSSSDNILSNNTCSGNQYGMYLESSSDNTLTNNNCSNNIYGILLYQSSNNTLSNSTVSNFDPNDNRCGMCLESSSDNNTLSNSTCSNNYYGILLDQSSNNTLSNNTCSNNQYGMYLESSSDNNIIWNNSFYNNNGATDTYDSSRVQARDYGTGNWWNNTDDYGNYWSDWTSPDLNMDGIVDFPYEIGGDAGAKDWYPLTEYPYIPEFSSALAPVLVMLLVVVLMTAIRRSREK